MFRTQQNAYDEAVGEFAARYQRWADFLWSFSVATG